MGRPLKISHPGVDLGYNNLYGVVGGDTATSGLQVLCRVKIRGNAEANGFIVRQKGARKFLVSDGTNVGICVLADSDNASLADDTMTVTVTKADASTVRLAKFSNNRGLDFSGNAYVLSFGSAGVAPAGSLYSVVTVSSL